MSQQSLLPVLYCHWPRPARYQLLAALTGAAIGAASIIAMVLS